MKLRKVLPIVFVLFVSALNAQTQNVLEFAQQTLDSRGEFYFQFTCDDVEILQELEQQIAIDEVRGDVIYAYAYPDTFDDFLAYNLKFVPVESYYDTSRALTMATTTAQMASWDRYPTHAVYEQMMQDFVTNYPDICELEVIGQSENGVDLLAIKISDNVSVDEDEPEFFWSNTMHGDELVAYVLSLRFIDYLLSNYGTDPQVTNLVNEIEIYCNPLANPDGTFNGSASYTSVSSATRANANNVDLNRNFPTCNGDPYTLQAESNAMISYADSHDFVMSVNTHSGIELINHPWDTWQSWERLHPDNDWWVHVGFVYANQVEIDAPATYFEGPGSMDYGDYNSTGVTHGADWYYAIGSRQDYMNYYQHCREITLEWSDDKLLDVSLLPTYWDYNKQAMLNYTEQVLYGLRGIVTDACTGNPLSGVKVEIVGHDQDNTEMYSSAPIGNYHRPIYEGTYDFTFSLTGYQSQTHSITITNDNTVRLDVELIPDNVASPNFSADQTSVFEGTSIQFTDLSSGTVDSYSWTLDGGTPNTSPDQNPSSTYNTAGTYDVNLEITSQGCTVSELKEDYIVVSAPAAPIADFEASTTSVAVGGTVDFTDLSTNVPNVWSWTFEGGTPGSSTDQNPSITYNTAGTYQVSLEASNSYGADTETKFAYITVVEPDILMQNGSIYQCSGVFYDAGGTSNYANDENYELTIYPSSPASFIQVEFVSFDVEPNGADCYDYLTIYDGENTSAIEIGTYCGTDPSVIGTNGVVTASTTSGALTFVFTSDGGVNQTGWEANVSCSSSEIPPTAGFSAAETSSCTGEIQFQDESALATGWTWNFGDGNTSNDQNPLHTYTADGTYTVSLEVTNDHGSDNTSIVDYITIDMPDVPGVSDAESCGPANITLLATADGEVNWYDAASGGNLLATGLEYTDNFSATTTLYLDNTITSSQSFTAGKTDNSGDGGYFTNTNEHGLIFDAYTDFVIEEVTVYADGAADRTITLYDNTDTEIASTTVSISDGESVVSLNFAVSAGTDYTLMGPGSPNLYRNGGGSTGTLAYPFETSGILSIHDNTAGNLEYYYYFYDWQVRVDETCISAREAVNVTIHDLPTVDLGDDQAICDGDDYTFDAGSGFSTYTWTPTGTGQTFVADQAGNYDVIVEDANGCTATDNVNLTVNPNPELTFSTTLATGTNADGSITVNLISGDEAPLTYTWNTLPEQTTQTASNLPAGNYCVTVVNGFGCATVACDNIDASSMPPVPDFTADETESCGFLTVQFTDLSSNSPISWSWDFGDGETSTEQNPQHIYNSAGTYTVELTATNSYGTESYSLTDYITVYDELVISEVSDSHVDVACFGSATGELEVNAIGGDSDYSFTLDAGAPQASGLFSGLSAGGYTLQVIDGVGCSDNMSVFIIQADLLEVTVNTIDESALDACDGSVSADVSGGTLDYTYLWSESLGTDQTVSDLCAGTYQVTVTDALGCTATAQGVVAEGPVVVNADFSADELEGCEDHTVQFSSLSSSDVISWTWSFGDGSSSNAENPEHVYTDLGLYTVELIVENASSETDTETKVDYIHVLDRPELDFDVTHESSAAAQDGEITVLITGTDFPYEISWSNDEMTETITGLSGGYYSVAVTGNNGCAATDVAEVQTLTGVPAKANSGTLCYPNPVSGILHVESSEQIQEINVFSVDGRKIFTLNPQTNLALVSMPEVSGVYLLSVSYESGSSEVFRIIVE